MNYQILVEELMDALRNYTEKEQVFRNHAKQSVENHTSDDCSEQDENFMLAQGDVEVKLNAYIDTRIEEYLKERNK